MERIKLFTDSGSDISKEDAEKYNIDLITTPKLDAETLEK